MPICFLYFVDDICTVPKMLWWLHGGAFLNCISIWISRYIFYVKMSRAAPHLTARAPLSAEKYDEDWYANVQDPRRSMPVVHSLIIAYCVPSLKTSHLCWRSILVISLVHRAWPECRRRTPECVRNEVYTKTPLRTARTRDACLAAGYASFDRLQLS